MPLAVMRYSSSAWQQQRNNGNRWRNSRSGVTTNVTTLIISALMIAKARAARHSLVAAMAINGGMAMALYRLGLRCLLVSVAPWRNSCLITFFRRNDVGVSVLAGVNRRRNELASAARMARQQRGSGASS